MIVSSELLELIGASLLSYKDVGGMKGLIKSGIFKKVKKQFNKYMVYNANKFIFATCLSSE